MIIIQIVNRNRRPLDAMFRQYMQRFHAEQRQQRRTWLLVHFRHPSSELHHQGHCLLTPYAGRLDDEGNRVNASNDVRITYLAIISSTRFLLFLVLVLIDIVS